MMHVHLYYDACRWYIFLLVSSNGCIYVCVMNDGEEELREEGAINGETINNKEN